MKRLKMGIRACMLAILLSVLLTSMAGGATYAASLNCGTWSVIKSPNPGHGINILNGTATISAKNVWAVGTADQSSAAGLHQTLIEHWNGTKWSVVKSPDVGVYSNYLYGVAAISASNIWAVGAYFPAVSISATLIEHWNGSSWSVVSSPSPGGSPNYLQGVTVVSSNDVWAVGHYYTSHDQALAEHWNGTGWSIVQTPSLGFEVHNYFKSVTAVASSNVWAVGWYASGNGYQTLIEQWNGTSWNVVKSPNAVSDNYLNAVVATSANNIWAVGGSGTVSFTDHTVFTAQTLTEQWNGSGWSVVKSANPGSGANSLFAVAALDATHLWTVGTQGPSSNWSNSTLTESHC